MIMDTKLLKVLASDCPVCASLSPKDEELAKQYGHKYIEQDYLDLAQSTSLVRDYVVHYHVLPNDGIIDIPIYVITDREDRVMASAVVKTTEDLEQLLQSWERYLKSVSSERKIK